MKKALIFSLIAMTNLYSEFYYSQGREINLTPIENNHHIKRENRLFFKDNHNNTIAISNEILIKYKDISKKEEIEKEYDLTFIKSISKGIYLYKVPKKEQSLNISNTLYNLKESIKYAHPNFIKTKKRRTNDPLFSSSWHLKNSGYNSDNEDLTAGADIDVEGAWDITKGEGVKVGVIDDAIDIYHEDLKENIEGYRNFADPNSDIPSPNDDEWHGTSSAGLIVAQENDKGSVGIAPKAKLYAIKYGTDTASDIESFMWLDKQGVSIISNSWGTGHIDDALQDAFETLTVLGRDGKGTIILFASGNDSLDYDAENNADIDDESESPFVFSIGATSGRDTIESYSNYGSSLDFVAPGGSGSIVTTDVSGSRGYNSGNYNNNFSGTSAATPIVAGVIALMLSANPNLTRDDVYEILKGSSDKVGNDNYDNQGHNNKYGYGRVNARKAVSEASNLMQTVLYPPTKLTFTDITAHSVKLNWNDNTNIESGYKIYRDNILIHKTSANQTSYTDSNLNQNRSYKYTIKATDDE